MKIWLVKIVFIFCLSTILNSNGICQELEKDSSEVFLLNVARNIIKDARFCVLISLDEEGRARSRMMDPFPPEDDLTIWFGTNSNSRKVSQIENDARVTIIYTATDYSGYTSLYGQAKIVNDNDKKQQYFKEEWTRFYSNYPDDYRLIQFTPEWIEVISIPNGINGDVVTWKPSQVHFINN